MNKPQYTGWFERYAVKILNEFGGAKNLIVCGLAGFWFGFIPYLIPKEKAFNICTNERRYE